MCAMHVVATVAAASAFAPGLGGHAGAKPALSFRLQPQSTRTSIIALNDDGPVSYEEYLRARGGDANGADTKSAVTVSEATRDASPDALPPANGQAAAGTRDGAPDVRPLFPPKSAPLRDSISDLFADVTGKSEPRVLSDTDEEYWTDRRVPWWQQESDYSEKQRENRRTIFMHDDWVRHRSSDRFFRNMLSIGSSGINQALKKELTFVTAVAVFIVVFNMLFVSYQDLSGISHVGPLNWLDANVKAITLPALPFTVMMPALSLLLVFRTNTGYSRWNEARTLWGGLINNCRNVVRQANTFFPDDPKHHALKRRLSTETGVFAKALRNFLRGPSDDETLRNELYELVAAGLMPRAQADATMEAKNRPMFALSAMSATLRKADIDPIQKSRIDTSISVLVDLTGANERIFKSPIPLVYTRHTSRFLTFFLTLLPLALWGQLGESWNHWATIPAEFVISFFLFGIEEVGIQIEEPFSILPLEAFCDGAIKATNEEMLKAEILGTFDEEL